MPDLTPDAAAELRRLRAETAAMTGHVTAMRAQAAHAHIRHGWLKHVVKDLETNPRTQYKVHNASTDYGSMSAAMAAYGEGPLPEIPLEPVLPPDRT